MNTKSENIDQPERVSNAALTPDARQLYRLQGKVCPQCESTGPFLLDPAQNFTVCDDGSLEFPPGEWGLDIDCDCPARGFAAILEDFCVWVELTGDELAEFVEDFRRRFGPMLERDRLARMERFEAIIAAYDHFAAAGALIDLLEDAMRWAQRNEISFEEQCRKAARRVNDGSRSDHRTSNGDDAAKHSGDQENL